MNCPDTADTGEDQRALESHLVTYDHIFAAKVSERGPGGNN
jgi:hypothetical protein